MFRTPRATGWQSDILTTQPQFHLFPFHYDHFDQRTISERGQIRSLKKLKTEVWKSYIFLEQKRKKRSRKDFA